MSDSPQLYQKLVQDMTKVPGGRAGDKVVKGAMFAAGPGTVKMLEASGLFTTTSPFTIFDSACGSGLTAAMLNQAVDPEVLKESSILCGDVSEQMVSLVKNRIDDEGWVNTKAEVRDAQRSGLEENTFTHVTIGMGLHVIPDPESTIQDCIRILKPGGTLAFTTFPESGAGWVPDTKAAMEALFPGIPFSAPMQLHDQGRWFDYDWVRNTLLDHGFKNVKVELTSYVTHVDGPEHFVTQFAMMFDLLRATQWTEELRAKYSKEEVRESVKSYLSEKYGEQGWDITWSLIVGSGQLHKVETSSST